MTACFDGCCDGLTFATHRLLDRANAPPAEEWNADHGLTAGSVALLGDYVFTLGLTGTPSDLNQIKKWNRTTGEFVAGLSFGNDPKDTAHFICTDGELLYVTFGHQTTFTGNIHAYDVDFDLQWQEVVHTDDTGTKKATLGRCDAAGGIVYVVWEHPDIWPLDFFPPGFRNMAAVDAANGDTLWRKTGLYGLAGDLRAGGPGVVFAGYGDTTATGFFGIQVTAQGGCLGFDTDGNEAWPAVVNWITSNPQPATGPIGRPYSYCSISGNSLFALAHGTVGAFPSVSLLQRWNLSADPPELDWSLEIGGDVVDMHVDGGGNILVIQGGQLKRYDPGGGGLIDTFDHGNSLTCVRAEGQDIVIGGNLAAP